jgi:hypothetical protein
MEIRSYLSPRTVGAGFTKPTKSLQETFNQFNVPCRWEFVYDAKGGVAYEKDYDRDKMMWGLVYSPPTQDPSIRHAHYVDSDGFPKPWPNSSAEVLEIRYSPDGKEAVLMYFNRNHEPEIGPDGHFGIRQEYDAIGLVGYTAYLDKDGNPTVNSAGAAGERKSYNKFGDITEWAMLDSHGQPLAINTMQTTLRMTWDRYGNPSGFGPIIIDGKPLEVRVTLDKIIHSKDYSISAVATYGKDRVKAIIDFNKLNWHNLLSKKVADLGVIQASVYYEATLWKATLNLSEREGYYGSYNSAGTPIAKEGCHKVTFRLGRNFLPIQDACFDIAGHAATFKGGYHEETARYDERGNQIEWAYFDVSGNPTIDTTDGTHKMTGRYDKRGHRIEWAYFDVSGNPTIDKTDGTHKMTARYDERGNQIERAYFDVSGNPTIDKTDGTHKVTGRYDKRGHRIEWAYFDVSGNPTIDKTDGTHKMTCSYDERGNRIESAYFDTGGRPTLHKDGYHKVTGRYDERGNRIEWAYFDTEDRPMLYKDGYHKVTGRYDERGNRIEWAYFDTEDRPMLYKDGYHKVTGRYDERGNRIEWAYFDTEDRPMLYKDGYHKVTGRYDERGNRIEWAYFDTEDRPMLYKDGYHKVTGRYDERGNRIEWAYFDAEGRPTLYKGYHEQTAKYDKRGNRTESAFFDTEGHPALDAESGAHRALMERHVDKRTLTIMLFGTDGQPMQSDKLGGAYGISFRYDAQKRPIEIIFLGEDNQPMRNSEGWQRQTIAYDDQGNKIEQTRYGLDGSQGYMTVRDRFDSQGRQIEEAFFDSDGKPTRVKGRTPRGYTLRKTEYGPGGSEKHTLLGFDPAVWGYETMTRAANHVQCLDQHGVPVPTELVVTMVLPESQAEKLGVRVGDVLTHYDGEPIQGDVLTFIKRRKAERADGSAHEVRVRRQGHELRFEVKPGKLGLGLQDRGISVMTAKLGRADAAKAHRHDPRRKLVTRHRAARAAHSRSP